MQFTNHPLLNSPLVWYWLIPVLVIDSVLKGMALWRAGRNNQLGWFVALSIINSAGILPAFYLLFVDHPKR